MLRAAFMLAALALPVVAQQPRAVSEADRQALQADARSIELRQSADAADVEARRARVEAITLARRIQAGEVRANRIESRIRRIETLARSQRARLASRQGEVARLLAALQTLSRRPAALVLLEPRAAIETARVSALLDSVRPILAERTATLRSDLAETRRLRAALLAARVRLARSEAALAGNIKALDQLQAEARRTRDILDAEADAERLRARELAGRALDLRGLARAVESDGRPAAAFIGRRGAMAVGAFRYRLPAAGGLRLGFGRRDEAGVRARGLTLLTRDNAQVTAPAGGRIAYAGPFRAYGDIVIVEHASGMLSLLSGLERVDVVVGETVGQGTPIGRMGSASPQLYLELRQNGRPVDPARFIAGRG